MLNKPVSNPGLLTLLVVAALGLSSPASAEEMLQGPADDPITLAQTSADEPQTGSEWRARGDELLGEGRPEEALEAYQRAEALGAGDEEMRMDMAQIHRELGNEREAYWAYHSNRYAKDPDIRAAACEGMNELQWARSKRLPDPYFADLGVYGGWQSIEDAAYVDAIGRIGMVRNETLPEYYYLFGRFSRDNRSGLIAGFPEEYFDNVGILGVGAQKYIVPEAGLKMIGEVGYSRDLEDLGRDRNRTDVRAGFEHWKAWYTDYDCYNTDRFPNRFVMTTWAELMYYSRYDDAIIFSADARPGIRIYESPKSAVDALAIFSVNLDSEADETFQYGEAGVGLSWTPDHRRNFKITAKAVETFDEDGSAGENYVLEFEYYNFW